MTVETRIRPWCDAGHGGFSAVRRAVGRPDNPRPLVEGGEPEIEGRGSAGSVGDRRHV